MVDENKDERLPDHTEVPLAYAAPSGLRSEDGGARLTLYGNLRRDPVHLDGVIRDPLALREALSAMYAVVGSDYRYVPKDRAAYHAFRRMRRESANLNAWQAQQAYYDWLSRNDPLAFCILDPVITVHPDAVFFEVFSKDEGSYANLSIGMDAFDLQSEPVCGTTNIDFSESLYESVQRFRSYRETRITIGQQAVKVATEGQPDVLEKHIKIPDSWLRGFLQVQSATMLPADTLRVSAMDMYNALRHLRMNGDQKGKRRGMRFELIPGELPRIVLEPWETVLPSSAAPYSGRQPKVVRIWGRRRLMMLRRLLPYVDDVEIHLMGSGLPSFWVLRAGPMTFTLGLTGFTASNWAQSVNFDLLLPRVHEDSAETASSETATKSKAKAKKASEATAVDASVEKVVKHLAKRWADDRESLAKATKLEGEALTASLQTGCQHGQLMYDLAGERYRLRPLTAEPLELDRLEFRGPRQRLAYDLVHRKGAVSIVTENRIHGVGLELTGKADVAEDKREYRPQLLLNDEGFVSRAECTCNTFRQQGLKSGPCTCLIALRLSFAMRERERQASGRARNTVMIETRSFSRRRGEREEVVQLSLNRNRLRLRWGPTDQPQRSQQLQFTSVEAARNEYFERISKLEEAGYLDASL
ncbi:MAG: hypothetical protein KDB14_27780 [Planctomycetales bacterium]|nr:hypothetical protein [Planctomycetales bacterium]